MRTTLHPEYEQVYLSNATANKTCRSAVLAWRGDGTSIPVPEYDLVWTPASAQRFVEELSALFQAYNRVLWEQFSYCGRCGGQCCVVDASDVRPFDLVAVALLDQPAPGLGDQVQTTAQGCIYLNGHQCTWPDTWRTIKCWSFYCLGSGPWDALASLQELYAAVTEALRTVVETHLPDALRRYEQVHSTSLAASLDDPVRFAHAVNEAIHNIFVAPFHARYPHFDLAHRGRRSDAPSPPSGTAIPLLDGDVMSFIAEATVALVEKLGNEDGDEDGEEVGMDISPEVFLADLETLEWILMGRPANGRTLLLDMERRYEHVPTPQSVRQRSLISEMQRHVQTLLAEDFPET